MPECRYGARVLLDYGCSLLGVSKHGPSGSWATGVLGLIFLGILISQSTNLVTAQQSATPSMATRQDAPDDQESTLVRAADVATIAAALATIAALIYAGQQLKHSRHVATADLLLRIDELLTQYNDIHEQLIVSQFLSRNPHLPQPANGGESLVSTFQKNSYMGLLERVNILMETGLLDIETVHHLYEHRVQTLAQDPEVCEWLIQQPEG